MVAEFNSLFSIERSFNKLISAYILFSKLNEFTSKISLKNGRVFNFEISFQNIIRIKKVIGGKNDVGINYDLLFIVENENLDFIKFFYKLSEIYQQNLAFNPNFLIKKIIPDIISKIKSSEPLKESTNRLLEYDKENKGVFGKFERETLQNITKYQGVYVKIKEELHDKFFDLSPENYEVIEYLIKEFRKQNSAQIDIASFYEGKEQYLFELYYKQVICDDISYQLNTPMNYHLLSLRDPNLNEGHLTSENTVFLGRMFQDVIAGDLKDAEDIDNYSKISTIFKKYLTDGSNTPYSIVFSENFNHTTFTDREKLYLYKNPIGKGKSRGVFPYDRFLNNYMKGTLTTDQEDFVKMVKQSLALTGTVFGKKDEEQPTDTFPRLFFNGDTFGLVSLENLTASESSINLRAMIFNTSSRNEFECLNHFKKSWNFSKTKLFRDRIREQRYLMEKLFDFYPYHPYFFNRKNHYAQLYTAFVLGENPNSASIETELEKLYLVPEELDILWESNSIKGTKLSKDPVKTILKERVLDAYNKGFYLWMMIYLEKYQYFLGMLENEKGFGERSTYKPRNLFREYIKEVEDYLNESFKGERLFRIVVDSAADKSHKYKIVGMSRGLYYFLIYFPNTEVMYIIKLNCVSFIPEEIKFFSKVLEFSEVKSKIEEFQVPSNFMRGLKINNINSDTFKTITDKPNKWAGGSYDAYDYLMKAHRLSEMDEFKEEISKENWPYFMEN